jgi:hypothetical protein
MADSWHVVKGKTKQGPYSREQLKRLAQAGQLRPTDLVLPAGAAKWVPASTVAGVFPRSQPPAAPPAPTAPAKPTAAPAAGRSTGKIVVLVGAVLAVCACLVGVPASLAVYFLLLAPRSTLDGQVAAARGNGAQTIQQPALPDLPNIAPPGDPATTKTPATDSPKVDPPKVDLPQSDPPKADPPKADPPKADPPKADPPKADPPKADPLKKNLPAGDQLSPDALRLVKQATVYLRVTLPDGRVAQGSGFFAGGPDIVLTNGHVLGMLSPEGRPPQKIEVVVHSGAAEEKTYTARLRQVDARDDLAAIAVDVPSGAKLPPPLAIGRGKDLIETQAVFVFGFPFGKQLGRNITVSKTSVSSIRTKADGAIQDLIVSGGMHPGNSGGPVVDGNGLVVGMSVAVIAGTQINFAIAGETVQSFLTGRMQKRVYMAPYQEGDKLKLPIRYHLTDPLNAIAKVVVDTWTGKPGATRPLTETGAAALPDDSPRRSHEFGYRQHKAEGEVDLPVMTEGQALWVQLALVRRDGSRTWYPASAYPNKLAPVERKPVTLSYTHRPELPCKLELTQTTDLKVRGINGLDKHYVTEIKAQMTEQLIDKRDAGGKMPGLILFKQVTLKQTVDKEVRRDPILDNSLKSLAALAALTVVDKQGDLKPAGMAINNTVRDKDTKLDLSFVGRQLLTALEAVTVPLPGREVRHELPWKVKREILLGSSARSLKPAVMDVDCILHGLRVRNGRPEAVIFLFGQVRGAPGAVFSASGYMDGVASVDLQTNQVRFAEANLNLDLDLADGDESFPANGTRKITLVRTPLEGAERDQLVKAGGPSPPPMPQPGGPMPGGPMPGGPQPSGPVGGGKTKIQGGGNDPEFNEAAPAGGLLVGFEIGLQKFFNNDVVRAMRPIFRAGDKDKDTLGTQRGTDLKRVVKVVAKPGYAVGAITAKAGLTVDGMSVTFMKIAPDGRLNPNDTYESDWIGGKGGGAPQRLGGDGTPIIGVIGRTNMRDMTGLGLLLRQ